MADKKKRKIRALFRKNRVARARSDEWTRRFQADPDAVQDDAVSGERISGKGELTRKRTVVGDEASEDRDGLGVVLDVDESLGVAGVVLSVHGLTSSVQAADGKIYRCATRRLLKTLSTDQRHVVATGDRVMFRRENDDEGIIERVEPRRTVLSRATRGRRQILVANVDQLVIVASAAEPYLKPNLIDRFLISSHHARLSPLIVINKIDLMEVDSLAPLVGVYSQMGYRLLMVSAATGFGIERLRAAMQGLSSVVSGQSGVGKSSLLNAIDPTLGLRVRSVSAENQKGRHTTTTASLWPLSGGGYVVDTPGIRQFELWDVIPAEVAGYFRDLRNYINDCRYPNCTHLHETGCAVKDAVADGRLDLRRYESYCQLMAGEGET